MTFDDVKNVLKSTRQHNRMVIELTAKLDLNGEYVSCTACDVSLGGVRLKVDARIKRGDSVVVTIKDALSQVANVIWASQGFVGLIFKENPDAIKEGLGQLASDLN